MAYTKTMKLIVGLGNPEKQYRGTRHNVGFWILDAVANENNTNFKLENKFHALVATILYAREKILLIQPQTYYNDVGLSVRAIMDFYKLTPADTLIVHDDLALPLGTIRTRLGGSDGGNNGLKSIAAHIGTDTARLRVGTWNERIANVDKVNVVLGKFSQSEQAILDDELLTIKHLLTDFATGTFAASTYKSSQ